MADGNTEKKEKGGCGTILAGILILSLVIGFVLFRAGIIGEAPEEEPIPGQDQTGLEAADAVPVEVGQDFAEVIDPEEDTLIRFHAEETGMYYAVATMNGFSGEQPLIMHTYKTAPRGNDMMNGISLNSNGNHYKLQLSGSPCLSGDTDYYIIFDWQKDCGVESIAIEFEPLEMAELDENLVKELGAVQLVEGETYEGPFKVGEENWFYIILDREGSPVFDLTFSKEQTPGVVAMEHMELYVQQEDGTLIPVRDNDITTGLEGNMIHRRAPSYSPLPTANPYFLSIYMEEDQGLKKLDMKISGKPGSKK